MGSLWGATSKALEKGSWAIGTVGSKVQEKLDQTGITENVSYAMNAAAEGTKNLGSAIITKGSEKFEQVQQISYVSDFTEKSKSMITSVGGTVSGTTTVSTL